MSDERQQPELHVLHPRTMTFADVLNLFRKLTGRELTAEEIEEARTEWDKEESEEC
jgi:hypothetical protein